MYMCVYVCVWMYVTSTLNYNHPLHKHDIFTFFYFSMKLNKWVRISPTRHVFFFFVHCFFSLPTKSYSWLLTSVRLIGCTPQVRILSFTSIFILSYSNQPTITVRREMASWDPEAHMNKNEHTTPRDKEGKMCLQGRWRVAMVYERFARTHEMLPGNKCLV